MIAFLIDVEFVWGFQARIAGFSKTNPSFLYPPPTTFLGAVAEAIARKHRLGEKKGLDVIPALSKVLLGIGFRPINFIPLRYEDINRIITIKITSGKLYPAPEKLTASFDSPARGKTILSTFNKDPPKLRWPLVLSDDKISIDGQEIGLSEEIFWKIRRLGSKESLVSVVGVESIRDVGVVSEGVIETFYSFPFNRGMNCNILVPSWERETYIDPFRITAYSKDDNPIKNYLQGEKIMTFYVPIMKGHEMRPEMQVELKDGLVGYNLGEEDYLIGRRGG